MNNAKVSPEKCQILVLSYDGFSDLWPIFFDYFFKYWPDCPFEINLLTNFKEYPDSRVKSLRIGNDEGWADGVIKALDKINTERVLFLYEDAFLNTIINTEEILFYYKWAVDNNSDYLRIRASPPPRKKINEFIGLVLPGSMYRVSMYLSFFRKETLLKIIDKKENAWEFEFIGSGRSDIFVNWHSSLKSIIPYDHGIVKGMWTKEVLPIIAKYNIDPLKRGIYHEPMIVRILQGIVDFCFKFIPAKYERPFYFFLRGIYFKIKNIFN